MIRRAVTKTVSIDRDVKSVFFFLADPANWPRWATGSVQAARRAGRDWWDLDTPAGPARLRIYPDEAQGVLDHELHADDARWAVPARVVPNGDGCELLLTLIQPQAWPDEQFDRRVASVDVELATLKALMEQRR